MKLKNYIEWTRTTRNNSLSEKEHKLNAVVGLTAEAGELLDLHKKIAFQGHPEEQHSEDIVKELGDVFWYLAYIIDVNNLNLEEIIDINVDKLSKRYNKGFSEVSSSKRKEYMPK